MTTQKIAYAAAAAVTITLASLASDTNLLAGRASTVVDNSSNLYDDAILEGVIKTAAGTADRVIEVWLYALSVDATPAYTGGATGTDANLTVASNGVKRNMRLALTIDLTDTTARSFPFNIPSVAQVFGGAMPKKWGVFVVQNSAAALDSTGGNHVVGYVGITWTNT